MDQPIGVRPFWLVAVKRGLRMRTFALGVFIVIIASLVIRIMLASKSETLYYRIYEGSDTRADGIAYGVLIALALNHARRYNGLVRRLVHLCEQNIALFVAVLIFLVTFGVRDEWFRDTFQYSLRSIATCLLIIYGFGDDQTRLRRIFVALCNNRAIQLIGLASYSIYLAHSVVIEQIAPLSRQWPTAINVPVEVLVGTSVGIAAYYAVERPAQRLRKSRAQKSGS